MDKDKYIRSPLNYTGGKYKILDNILPQFPVKIHNFVDLFAGGLNVGINVSADNIYVNDQIIYLIDLYAYLKRKKIDKIIDEIKKCIEKYKLTEQNLEGYLALRKEYNCSKNILDLFVLTCYSFNHQIRFNNSHEFNTPFGKERSCYNKNIEDNLIRFVYALQKKNIILSNVDFNDFNFSVLQARDLVYCDPPYLITTGSYNDGKRGFKDWGEKEEIQLLELLDSLNSRDILFALSNVFYHKGKKNELLIKWSKKYNIQYIDKSYSNCSYHFKNRETKTVEVLITNFQGRMPMCQQQTLEF